MEELSSLVTRQIMTHSEITKKFERSVTWPISIHAGTDSGPESEAIGEYVVVIEAVDSSVPEGAQLVTRLERASAIFGVLTNSDGISNEEAIVAASAACSVQPAKFRRWLKKVRYSSQAGREAT
jgi:hypothetical protein